MTNVTIADGWVQLHHPAPWAHRAPYTFHIPRANGSDHAVCGKDLRRATAVTPEGAAEGVCCHQCARMTVGKR